MQSTLGAIESGINGFSERLGFVTALLILPLVGVVVYEVFMRYVFNAPTIWAFETTTFIYGTHFTLGFAFTHRHDGHVSIDILQSRLPEKPRLLMRIALNFVFFIPTIGLLSVGSVVYAATSWEVWELGSTSWAPPFYPFKTLMALGFIFFFVQGIGKLISDIRALGRVNSAGETSGGES